MSDQTLFVVMIFAIGFLLSQAFVRPLMGGSGKARRRLRQRIRDLSMDAQAERHVSLVRERYLKNLSPWEVQFLGLPGMERLRTLIEQSGSEQLPHRLALLCLVSAAAGVLITGMIIGWRPLQIPIVLACGALPIMRLQRRRSQRLERFEEQLPEALTVAARALRAGLPFTEALNLVSQEIKDPAGTEFGIVFTEINYGGDPRRALLGLLERVPNVAVMAMVTSILIQRDTGGNLAELLHKLAELVRQRFRFQRSVRTLSAEGRMAAWILALLPFVISTVINLVNPQFLPMLTADPTGRTLVLAAFGFMVVGILWMRRIVAIDV